jgi:hypothetical protein
MSALHDELKQMLNYTEVYEPFMYLSGVGGHRANARLLSYLLHLHTRTSGRWVMLDSEAYRVLEMSPFDLQRSKEALVASAYVETGVGGRLQVRVDRLMQDVHEVKARDTTPLNEDDT